LENAKVAFVGYGITSEAPAYNDFDGIDLEGKVAIILRRTPKQPEDAPAKFKDAVDTLVSKMNFAKANKASAILVVNDASVKDADDLVRYNFAGSPLKTDVPPVFHVKRAFH
jgi:hypothetical protein